jgi:hypothetical protein
LPIAYPEIPGFRPGYTPTIYTVPALQDVIITNAANTMPADNSGVFSFAKGMTGIIMIKSP